MKTDKKRKEKKTNVPQTAQDCAYSGYSIHFKRLNNNHIFIFSAWTLDTHHNSGLFAVVGLMITV